MKFTNTLYLIFIFIGLSSCSSETSETAQESNDPDLTLEISRINRTTAKVFYSGSTEYENKKILYRKRNTLDTFQSIAFNTSEIILSELESGTAYEIILEVSNEDSSSQSNSYYFTTKFIQIDYEKFYSNYSWYTSEYYSPFEFFSHLNRTHVIHAEGLSDYDDVKVYLIDEQKTDSLEITATIVSDSLSFTIPNNYFTQAPRESFKKAYLGIQIAESYEYVLNFDTWVNLSQDSDFEAEVPNLKFKIYNNTPHISSIDLTEGDSDNCPNHTNILLSGDFFGCNNNYYWTAKQAELMIYDANNNLYGFYLNTTNTNPTCNHFSLSCNNTTEDGLLVFHQQKKAQLLRASNLPAGNYTAKIIFTLQDDSKVETNSYNFTKD